jgi:hypothetical protein
MKKNINFKKLPKSLGILPLKKLPLALKSHQTGNKLPNLVTLAVGVNYFEKQKSIPTYSKFLSAFFEANLNLPCLSFKIKCKTFETICLLHFFENEASATPHNFFLFCFQKNYLCIFSHF